MVAHRLPTDPDLLHPIQLSWPPQHLKYIPFVRHINTLYTIMIVHYVKCQPSTVNVWHKPIFAYCQLAFREDPLHYYPILPFAFQNIKDLHWVWYAVANKIEDNKSCNMCMMSLQLFNLLESSSAVLIYKLEDLPTLSILISGNPVSHGIQRSPCFRVFFFSFHERLTLNSIKKEICFFFSNFNSTFIFFPILIP